jgi:hypothetical protein
LLFSETVASGERWIRWRVDQHPVSQSRMPFYDDGKTYFLTLPSGRDTLVPQLRNAKSMKVEADLPWAGSVLIEFDVPGGAAAFAKIPCR